MRQTVFTVPTRGQGLYEITRDVADWVAGDGLLTLFIRHTSASLLIQENADPEVRTDLRAFFARLVPPSDHPSMSYLTHTYEGPDDMPAHVKSSLLGFSLTLPVRDGGLALGTWQGVYLCEHRDDGGPRSVIVTLQGE